MPFRLALKIDVDTDRGTRVGVPNMVADLMASEDALKKYNLKPMAKMTDFHFAGLEPERMGLGPVYSTPIALKRAGLTMIESTLFHAAWNCRPSCPPAMSQNRWYAFA